MAVLEALAQLGANLDAAMNGGFTPATIAASNSHVEALEVPPSNQPPPPRL